jgi:serine/threonine protein kinase
MKRGALSPYFLSEGSIERQRRLPSSLFLSGSAATDRSDKPSPAPRRETSRRPTAPRGALERGAILDKYRIEALIGTGGFGIVYRARHVLLDRPVALKLLRPEVMASHPGGQDALIREARMAARIDHPNVVRVLDATRAGDLCYVVMDDVAGQSLSAALRSRGTLPAADALRIGAEIAAALRAGLAQGLIHRDVKPSNILLAPDGSARLADFGLAHPTHGIDGEGRPGPVGTQGYMAPEVAAGRRGDFRSDLYSLGVTLSECLLGRGHGARAAEALPAELAALLELLLQTDPALRPASYDAALAAIGAARATVG